jgi:hypothetical protein
MKKRSIPRASAVRQLVSLLSSLQIAATGTKPLRAALIAYP